MIIARTRAKI